MRKPQVFTRPTFEEALKAWQTILRERSLPEDCLWLFEENLCFETPSGSAQSGRSWEFDIRYQTRFTPPPSEAERIAYRYFAAFERPIVFYRVGSAGGKSVCALLCDAWFEDKGQENGYVRLDNWFIMFYPGAKAELEEITDETRWRNRAIHGRPVHPLHFCMTLRAIHETLAHGRVLSPYEHYALRVLHSWKQLLPHKNKLDN